MHWIQLKYYVCRVLTFDRSCLKVSLPRSGLVKPGTHVLVIEKLNTTCHGRYTCQVTTASPPFYTGIIGIKGIYRCANLIDSITLPISTYASLQTVINKQLALCKIWKSVNQQEVFFEFPFLYLDPCISQNQRGKSFSKLEIFLNVPNRISHHNLITFLFY